MYIMCNTMKQHFPDCYKPPSTDPDEHNKICVTRNLNWSNVFVTFTLCQYRWGSSKRTVALFKDYVVKLLAQPPLFLTHNLQIYNVYALLSLLQINFQKTRKRFDNLFIKQQDITRKKKSTIQQNKVSKTMKYENIITGLSQQRLICSRLYIRKTSTLFRWWQINIV